MSEQKSNRSRPVAMDPGAESASDTLPAFLARPASAPVYHGFQILDDVMVDGFTLGLITGFEDGGATEGDAFIIAPDNSRAGLVWATADSPDEVQEIEQLCPMEKDRWGVWQVLFPLPMSNREDARQNLKAALPMLKPKWEEWRRTFQPNENSADR